MIMNDDAEKMDYMSRTQRFSWSPITAMFTRTSDSMLPTETEMRMNDIAAQCWTIIMFCCRGAYDLYDVETLKENFPSVVPMIEFLSGTVWGDESVNPFVRSRPDAYDPEFSMWKSLTSRIQVEPGKV